MTSPFLDKYKLSIHTFPDDHFAVISTTRQQTAESWMSPRDLPDRCIMSTYKLYSLLYNDVPSQSIDKTLRRVFNGKDTDGLVGWTRGEFLAVKVHLCVVLHYEDVRRVEGIQSCLGAYCQTCRLSWKPSIEMSYRVEDGRGPSRIAFVMIMSWLREN